jgi:ribose transport system permease protein
MRRERRKDGGADMSTETETVADGGAVAPQPRSLGKRLASSNTFWIAIVLVGICAVFSVLAPGEFTTLTNIQFTLIETSVLLILAVGMTFIIITSGIDLSVGSVLIFAGMVSGKTMEAISGGDATHASWGVGLIGLAAAVVSGIVWGLINGLLVAKAKVPPLVVTLGSFGAALGAAQLINGGNDVSTVPAVINQTIGSGVSLGVVPNMVLIAAVVTLVGAWLLHTTRFGRYTYAIGSNPEAARRSGIGVTRHLVLVYLLGGTLAGFAGFLSLAYFSTTNISGHATDNLDAISAVVIGGTSLFGGIGSMVGSVIGVFIPAVLKKGFVIIGLSDYWQRIAVAVVLVIVVWFDQQRRRSRNSR